MADYTTPLRVVSFYQAIKDDLSGPRVWRVDGSSARETRSRGTVPALMRVWWGEDTPCSGGVVWQAPVIGLRSRSRSRSRPGGRGGTAAAGTILLWPEPGLAGSSRSWRARTPGGLMRVFRDALPRKLDKSPARSS